MKVNDLVILEAKRFHLSFQDILQDIDVWNNEQQ